jgi:ATPase subunit of ABC transporter with duplicated ATPase domains
MAEVKIQKLMTEFGFVLEDADRFVASFSSGWKMRM